ncbi:anhydro-N-acetylmuramic acid kinase [Agarivorans sp. 1_MG-2023]|uniref:anhydro-N-acetylmuramic acid kinase n=1 Tax=Agarivorans sp. 1_MG-2023 TaxID=3062634 RepID=UPI0026E283F9|nr:anhydro-N-acetylmuramic acid kinase [Agarivorans sp. 1_MG-2023]MDO6763633.1 anhydro-N-acetylmuramic acid kinase [Agarivorans sp. 1_MG-2023]
MSDIYLGLMSGTSMDGVDAVVVDFAQSPPKLLAHHQQAIPAKLLRQLHGLCSPAENELANMASASVAVAGLFADTANQAIQLADLSADNITAIGSHGQTIRHFPELSFSLQIGSPSHIAVQSQIDVVADFRNKDMALGGQGAPLVPAFHQAMFSHPSEPRFILNIGGIANITTLVPEQELLGYDTGPGNTLLDQHFKRYHPTGLDYDDNGDWGRSGTLIPCLLEQMLSDDYFSLSAPKSTGREHFHLTWLDSFLTRPEFSMASPEDIQCTLHHLTSQSIAQQLLNYEKGTVYLCGGGDNNGFLLALLAKALPKLTLSRTSALGIPEQALEAMAFAWLARCFVQQQTGNASSVTGASKPAILGGFYPAN